MVIKNVTILSSLKDKTVGLLGKDSVYPVFFTTRWGIHTVGMMATIDVVILDDEHRAVKLATIPPFRLFFWNPRFSGVLELPAGTIKKNKIVLGEKITFAKIHG